MKVTITKGPNFEEAEKRFYAYLNKILINKVIEEQKKEKEDKR
jgi:hypothetical protein